MNLVIHIHSLGNGGAERAAAALAGGLAARRHRVTIVTALPAAANDYPLDAGIERISIGQQLHRWRPVRALQRVHRLRQTTRSLRTDCVLGFMTTSALYSVAACLGTPVAVLCCERLAPAQQRLSWFAQRLRPLLFARAQAVVCQTQGAARWYRQHTPRAKIAVIPNAVNLPLPDSLPRVPPPQVLSERSGCVLGIGRLDVDKGFDRLIRAFALIAERHRQIDLAILGEGAERSRLTELIEQHALRGRVHLVGRVGNLADWYRHAQLFVLSSRIEGFPNVLLEAMSHGCPVLAVDCDFGPSELITDDYDGVLLRSAAPEDLARAISALLDDGDRRSALAANAMRVTRDYAAASILDRWESVLRMALRPSGS